MHRMHWMGKKVVTEKALYGTNYFTRAKRGKRGRRQRKNISETACTCLIKLENMTAMNISIFPKQHLFLLRGGKVVSLGFLVSMYNCRSSVMVSCRVTCASVWSYSDCMTSLSLFICTSHTFFTRFSLIHSSRLSWQYWDCGFKTLYKTLLVRLVWFSCLSPFLCRAGVHMITWMAWPFTLQ